jgi:hypothetical protein
VNDLLMPRRARGHLHRLEHQPDSVLQILPRLFERPPLRQRPGNVIRPSDPPFAAVKKTRLKSLRPLALSHCHVFKFTTALAPSYAAAPAFAAASGVTVRGILRTFSAISVKPRRLSSGSISPAPPPPGATAYLAGGIPSWRQMASASWSSISV